MKSLLHSRICLFIYSEDASMSIISPPPAAGDCAEVICSGDEERTGVYSSED